MGGGATSDDIKMTRIEDFNYHLPPELVAQQPLPQRDRARLLVLNRATGEISHAHFRDLAKWLDPDDLLVVNDTRVFPARLHGVKESGGRVELLLHHLPAPEGNGAGVARARATHRGRLRPGQVLRFGPELRAAVISLPQAGVAEVEFSAAAGDVVRQVLAQGRGAAAPLHPAARRRIGPG